MMWWWWGVFVCTAISFAIEVGYAVKYRKPKFIFGIVILLYALALLSWVIFLDGASYYFVRSGLFTAILLIALLSLHAIDLICDAKRK